MYRPKCDLKKCCSMKFGDEVNLTVELASHEHTPIFIELLYNNLNT